LIAAAPARIQAAWRAAFVAAPERARYLPIPDAGALAVHLPPAPAVLLAALFAAVLCGAAPASSAAEPVRLASLEWQPYIGPELPEQGFAAALVRAAYAAEGMQVEIEFHPWERALALARSGAVDGLVPEYYNGRREAEFAYSAPLINGPLVLYRRREADLVYRPVGSLDAGLRALSSQRFGVVRGYLNTPTFDAADYLIKVEADDDYANLRNLAEGRIDLAVIDRHVAGHLIRTRQPELATTLVPLPPPLGEMALYIAFSRKSPRMSEVRAAFNRGLDTLRADGQLNRLRTRLLDGRR
jgi:ABC-type amino acid transport substrate-binding protein